MRAHAVEVDDKPVVPVSPALPKPHDLLPLLLPALRSFLRRFVRNAADAPDIAQEAAVRALSARDVPQNQRAYRVWLYQIARNAAIDAHRRAVLAEAVEPDQVNPWTADRSLINTISVRQALMQVPEDQRAVLLLVDVEGLSYLETARLLGLPTGTVMSRVSRARAALLAVISAGAYERANDSVSRPLCRSRKQTRLTVVPHGSPPALRTLGLGPASDKFLPVDGMKPASSSS